MDSAVIVTFYVVALECGDYTVFEGRPAWLVFSAGRFELVQVLDIDMRYISMVKKKYKTPSWFKLQRIAASPPESVEEKNNIIFESLVGGSDIA